MTSPNMPEQAQEEKGTELERKFVQNEGSEDSKGKKKSGRGTQLKKLKQIHHEIITLSLLGYQEKQIAEKLDKSRSMVKYTLNSEMAKKKMDILRNAKDAEDLQVLRRVQELAPIALEELERMLVDPNTNEANRRKIAQDLLDRAGYSAVEKHADVTDQMKTEDINEIKERAKDNGFMVEEAEVVEQGDSEESSESYDENTDLSDPPEENNINQNGEE